MGDDQKKTSAHTSYHDSRQDFEEKGSKKIDYSNYATEGNAYSYCYPANEYSYYVQADPYSYSFTAQHDYSNCIDFDC